MEGEVVRETAAEVAALIPKYSWELMDEEQRDALMAEVVLPRYGKTTSDGVKMGPTWWGELVGATARAVESRVYRLRQEQSQIEVGTTAANSLSVNEKAGLRSTKSTLARKPEAASALVESLDPETKKKLTEALIEDDPETVAKAVTATVKTTPAGIEATPVDSELWDWPKRLRASGHAHLKVVSEFAEFVDAYGSRIHKTSDGEEFTGADLAMRVLDEMKGELDLGYSNATGESGVDDAISQILA